MNTYYCMNCYQEKKADKFTKWMLNTKPSAKCDDCHDPVKIAERMANDAIERKARNKSLSKRKTPMFLGYEGSLKQKTSCDKRRRIELLHEIDFNDDY